MIAGVVPAAGHAERLRGLIEGSKELVPVRGKPVVDALLERLRQRTRSASSSAGPSTT